MSDAVRRKLCKDCRWAKAPEDGWVPGTVGNAYTLTCQHSTATWQPTPDMVMGLPREPQQLPCYDVRLSQDLCGREAKYWEPVQPVPGRPVTYRGDGTAVT